MLAFSRSRNTPENLYFESVHNRTDPTVRLRLISKLKRHDRGYSRVRKEGDNDMLALIAAVLIILWLLGFFAFHVTTAFIHVVLVVGLILLVLHFVRGSSASA